MTPQSAKSKGRLLQKYVCQKLYEMFGSKYGLEPDDFLSRSMGANGVDVILSPAARSKLGPLAIECKNVEKLNVHQVFKEHKNKYTKAGDTPVLIHKKNHNDVLVTLSLEDYLALLGE